MLKFSGYSYLIRGQPVKKQWVATRRGATARSTGVRATPTVRARAAEQQARCTGGPADAVIAFETGPVRDPDRGRSWGLGPTPNPGFEGG